MIVSAKAKKSVWLCALAGALLFLTPMAAPYAASNIVATVDNRAITNNDLRRRAALMKLQRRKGNLNALAKQELIDEALKLNEAERRNVRVPESRVESAFASFAKRNKLTKSQLGQVLSRAGIGTHGFKDFIRAQIAWNALVSSRLRSTGGAGGRKSMNDRLFEKSEGALASEYLLQQVIFFTSKTRGSKASINEAKTMRSGFSNCNNIKAQASNYRNVTVRSLGRVTDNRLPAEWKKHIEALNSGEVSVVRKTDRGAEFIAVCRKTSLGKEGAEQPGFNLGVQGGEKAEQVADKYLEDLRAKAVIR